VVAQEIDEDLYWKITRDLSYNPRTGLFTWKVRKSIRVKAGVVAGNLDKNTGYNYIGYNGKNYRAGRLAFFFMVGRWPGPTIDHDNRIRNDDRWCNLSEATYQEQQSNTKRRCNNKSGVTGVSYDNIRNKWRACIYTSGKQKLIGRFDDFEEAVTARRKMEERYAAKFSC